MFEPGVMSPPTSQTAEIDGPGYTGAEPGTLVGIISDPPSAGPAGDPGQLCVAVVVDAGAAPPPTGPFDLFPYVFPVIQVIDPLTGLVIDQISGLDVWMTE